MTGLFCLIVAFFPALSSSLLSSIKHKMMDVLQMFDLILVNWLLPIAAFIVSQFMYYGLTHEDKSQEFLREEGSVSPKIYRHWAIVLRWVFPGLVILAISLQVFHIFL